MNDTNEVGGGRTEYAKAGGCWYDDVVIGTNKLIETNVMNRLTRSVAYRGNEMNM